mmetsp:Transcript_42585/g.31176  ORF Transcript_42585/g.31176 Transcript_42585/m.31176 type:complete len:110 (+) Transcript_42585:221-550(+)
MDLAEDVAGGLKLGLEQEWQSKIRYAVLIADYPPHGKQYYSSTYTHYDNFPNGHPTSISIEALAKNYAHLGVDFNAIKITSETDKFFEIMGNEYKRFSGKDMVIGNLGS